jgi:hypothetical protein
MNHEVALFLLGVSITTLLLWTVTVTAKRFANFFRRWRIELMAAIDNVLQAVQAFGGKIDDLETKVGAAATQVTTEIARVEALIAAGQGATPEQLQQVLDGLNSASAKIDTVDAAVDAIGTTAAAERP